MKTIGLDLCCRDLRAAFFFEGELEMPLTLFCGVPHQWENLSASQMAQIKSELTKHLGCDLDGVVLVVPRFLAYSQKLKLRISAREAGFQNVYFLSASEALLLAYSCRYRDTDGMVLALWDGDHQEGAVIDVEGGAHLVQSCKTFLGRETTNRLHTLTNALLRESGLTPGEVDKVIAFHSAGALPSQIVLDFDKKIETLSADEAVIGAAFYAGMMDREIGVAMIHVCGYSFSLCVGEEQHMMIEDCTAIPTSKALAVTYRKGMKVALMVDLCPVAGEKRKECFQLGMLPEYMAGGDVEFTLDLDEFGFAMLTARKSNAGKGKGKEKVFFILSLEQLQDTISTKGQAIVDVTTFIADFLPTLDSFDRAFAAAKDKGSGVTQGMALIHRQLMEALEKHGLKRIDCMGKMFDPAYHEVVMTEKNSSQKEGIVLQEFEGGYTLNGNVIRPSKVAIAKN